MRTHDVFREASFWRGIGANKGNLNCRRIDLLINEKKGNNMDDTCNYLSLLLKTKL